MKELEFLTLDGLKSIFGRSGSHFTPEPGSVCDNCQTELHGLYCSKCGQTADPHHRSILHLTWEAIEGLLHLDGRLWRTLPSLFFRPDLLSADLMARRIARHVPPLRLFLVALLLFMFAAEHRMEQMRDQAAESAHQAQEIARDPARLKAAIAKIDAEAAKDYAATVREARNDYDNDLKGADTPAEKADVLATYQRSLAEAATERDTTVRDAAKAVTAGQHEAANMFLTPEQGQAIADDSAKQIRTNPKVNASPNKAFLVKLNTAFNKAMGNLDLFYVTIFTWGHRLAILLLPIMGLSLGLLYVYKRKIFIYDHLLVSANILSFLFLTNALMLALPSPMDGWLAGLLIFWTPVNIFMTLRGAYGSSILGATLKTLILWFMATLSFTLLLMGVVYVAMTSM